MTLFLEIASPLFIGAMGWFMSKFILEPVIEFNKTIKEIIVYFYETSPFISNPTPDLIDTNKISEKWRHLAGKLKANAHNVYFYNLVYKFCLLRYKREKVNELFSELIRVSNSLNRNNYNSATIENVKNLLKIN